MYNESTHNPIFNEELARRGEKHRVQLSGSRFVEQVRKFAQLITTCSEGRDEDGAEGGVGKYSSGAAAKPPGVRCGDPGMDGPIYMFSPLG